MVIPLELYGVIRSATMPPSTRRQRMVLGVFLLAAFVECVTSTAQQQNDWTAWKSMHNRQYENVVEENKRRVIWEANLELVEATNGAGAPFKLSMNQFADRHPLEMRSLRTPLAVARSDAALAVGGAQGSELSAPPASFNWVTKGVISPVKNQGQLGDVASIVTTECVESYNAIHTGALKSLSVQEVHDCCSLPGTTGFTCVHNIGGLCSAADYPPSTQVLCKNDSCTAAAKVNGSARVQAGNETSLQIALLLTPVSVAIDASQASFQLYQSGIYSDPKCSKQQVDHALQLVGYGVTAGDQLYWICKNSWGTSWGLDGYIWIARNKNNMCGIASYATYPI